MSTQQQPEQQPAQHYSRGTRVSVKGTGPGTVVGGVVKSDGSIMWRVLVDGAQRTAAYPAADVVALSVPAVGADSPVESAPGAATLARVSGLSDRQIILCVLALFVVACTASGGWGGLFGALILALPVAAIVRVLCIAFRPLARFAFGTVRDA